MSDNERQQMERLARLMDSAIRLPGGFRIGLDGIIGLVPGIGDAIGLVISSYLIGKAARMGASRHVLLRMTGNVVLETLVGSVPLVGDIFDFAFRANNRNMRLLQRHQSDASATEQRSRWWFYAVVALLVLGGLLLLMLIWRLLTALLQILF